MLHSSRRFYPSDGLYDTRGSWRSPRSAHQKVTVEMGPIKNNLQRHMREIARDLCILYSRQIILRSLSVNVSNLRAICSKKDEDGYYVSTMDSFLRLIRLCSSDLLETAFQRNLFDPARFTERCSISLYGGIHLLNTMLVPFVLAFNSSDDLMGKLNDIIHASLKKEVVRVTGRAFAGELTNDLGGLIPRLPATELQENNKVHDLPNFQFMLWITRMVAKSWFQDPLSTIRVDALIKTFRLWYFSLRSPSIIIKTLATRVLSLMVQMVHRHRPELCVTFLTFVDLPRINYFTLSLLSEERKVTPLCSEFFINVAEFTMSLSISGDKASEVKDEQFIRDGVLETSMRDRLFSDDTLCLWSGRIRQNPAVFGGGLTENLNDPPPLVQGCMVYRSSSAEGTMGKEIGAGDEIGKVIDISTWGGGAPGSARIVLWNSGTTETVRWDISERKFDVKHVEVDEKGAISRIFPYPTTFRFKESINRLKSVYTYGVILRANADTFNCDRIESIGLMEWPDFNAQVMVSVRRIGSFAYSITETALLSGIDGSKGWSSRFESGIWQPGTTYYCSFEPGNEDVHGVDIFGTYSLEWNAGVQSLEISGDLYLQQSRLFWFDSRYKSSALSVSKDNFIVTNVKGGKGLCFGHIGFSSGVHYWEFKIEQADSGYVFLGVAERPLDAEPSNLNKWFGCGMVSNRTAFNLLHRNSGSIVYGEHFHTGDIVGVQLDMNRGRIAFFLDGMKYGEHLLVAMGDAFDTLCSPDKGKTLVLYPVVGLQRSQDRVALTSKWISIPGFPCSSDFTCIKRVWNLISDCYTSSIFGKPFNNAWLYSQAWKQLTAWKKGKSLPVKTRLNCANMSIMLDLSAAACAESCIRLGLKYALFSGDRIEITKSCGRHLEVAEEAVVLGTYMKRLWYRLNGDNVAEGSSFAWFLAPYDTEGLRLLRRGSFVPEKVMNLPLSRIPRYRGGACRVICKDGAIMRNGLEIDTADIICTIDYLTTVFAIERRTNSSNIVRYRVLHNGALGWISAFMRGGSEDTMLESVSLSQDDLMQLRDEAMLFIHQHHSEVEIDWIEAESSYAALDSWKSKVKEIGCEDILGRDDESSCITYDEYQNLAYDSIEHTWSLEKDMALSELISKHINPNDALPTYLPYATFEGVVKVYEADNKIFGCQLDSIIARASLLITFNQYLLWALPFLSLIDPLEKLKIDAFGTSEFIEVLKNTQSRSSFFPEFMNIDCDEALFSNSAARRLLSLRRLIFSQTKRTFLEAVVDSTTTYTPPHVDEYEDPREIKLVKVNRVKATPSALAQVPNASSRWKLTVMGQLHKELRQWTNSNFRRSYVCKGHGGQKRCFKVQFLGEGVHDYGGPYRAVFEQVIDELQCDNVLVGRKPTDRCLLPLFIPSPNRVAGVGSNQDTFLISPSLSSAFSVSLAYFLGKFLGTAVRHNLILALDISNSFWRTLVRLPVTRLHLEQVDVLSIKNLVDIESTALSIEEEIKSGHCYPEDYIPEDWKELTFSTYLSDGSWIQLVPDGDRYSVTLSNWRQYVHLVEMTRLKENETLLRILIDGISCVLPREILPLFTASEARLLFTGESRVDVEYLKMNTEYENILPNSDLVCNFWDVLKDLGDENRTQFLRFVWARSRMPSSAQELRTKFKLVGEHRENPDMYLPHAQTCFFSLTLPNYSTKEILRTKLLYAIENSPNMDADVRLHNAEGWDS